MIYVLFGFYENLSIFCMVYFHNFGLCPIYYIEIRP